MTGSWRDSLNEKEGALLSVCERYALGGYELTLQAEILVMFIVKLASLLDIRVDGDVYSVSLEGDSWARGESNE